MSYKSPFTPFNIQPSSSKWSCDINSSEFHSGDAKYTYDTYGCSYNFDNGISLGGFVSDGGSIGGVSKGESGAGGGISFGFKFK